MTRATIAAARVLLLFGITVVVATGLPLAVFENLHVDVLYGLLVSLLVPMYTTIILSPPQALL